MQTQFDVELWVNTAGTKPETRVFKTVAAPTPQVAVREARQRVHGENPEINATLIDTWLTDASRRV